MDLSKLNIEERRKIELDNLSKANFSVSNLSLENESKKFFDELNKHCGLVKIIKLRIEAQNNMLWGSMGMQQFVNEFLNNENLKRELAELNPFKERYELKKEIVMGGNLFNLIGDLSSVLKRGGCYSDGSTFKNREVLNMTMEFVDQNLKEGYKLYHYIKIFEPWTKWFDPVWASSYLVINLYKDEMMLICITDTD